MPDSNRKEALEQLLAQDAPIPTEKYQEYRMQLDMRLMNTARMERNARWTIIGLWIASFTAVPILVYLGNSWPVGMPFLTFVPTALFIAATVETVSYFVRYRPALARARDERQTEMLRELDRKVSELSRRLDAQQAKPGTAEP
jgi:hypothetical protein